MGYVRIDEGDLMSAQARSFAAVLFRKQASKSRKNLATNESKDLFFTLSNEAKVAIRQQLLQCLATEQLSHVRNKIGDAIAEIARQYTDNGTYGGLVAFALGMEADNVKTKPGPNYSPPSSKLASLQILACENVLSGSLLPPRASSRSSMRVLCRRFSRKASRTVVWMYVFTTEGGIFRVDTLHRSSLRQSKPSQRSSTRSRKRHNRSTMALYRRYSTYCRR
jgi:hypothetical protein